MTSAPAVSAALRRAGFNPASPADRYREGLKVRSMYGGGAYVVADLDDTAAAVAMAADAASALADAGFVVKLDGIRMEVSR